MRRLLPGIVMVLAAVLYLIWSPDGEEGAAESASAEASSVEEDSLEGGSSARPAPGRLEEESGSDPRPGVRRSSAEEAEAASGSEGQAPYLIRVRLQTPEGESYPGSSSAGGLSVRDVLQMRAFGTAAPPGEHVSTEGGGAPGSAGPVNVFHSGSNIKLPGLVSAGEHEIRWTLEGHGDGPRYVGLALHGRTLVYEKVPPRVREVLLVLETATLAQHFGGVTMTLLDARDGLPLSGVRVGSGACCEATTTDSSDEHGRVEISGLLSGRHRLGIHAMGFASTGRSVKVLAGATTDVGEVRMVPQAQVHGRVTDTLNRPRSATFTVVPVNSGRAGYG